MSKVPSGLASSPSENSSTCFKNGRFQFTTALVKTVRWDKRKSIALARKAISASSSTNPSLLIALLVAVLGTFALVTPSFAQHAVPEGSAGEVDGSQPTPSLGTNDGVSEPGVNESGANATVVTPNGDRLTVRSGPGASYEIIGSLTNGQTLQLSEIILGNWIQLLGGGWVYLPYLQR